MCLRMRQCKDVAGVTSVSQDLRTIEPDQSKHGRYVELRLANTARSRGTDIPACVQPPACPGPHLETCFEAFGCSTHANHNVQIAFAYSLRIATMKQQCSTACKTWSGTGLAMSIQKLWRWTTQSRSCVPLPESLLPLSLQMTSLLTQHTCMAGLWTGLGNIHRHISKQHSLRQWQHCSSPNWSHSNLSLSTTYCP